MSFHKLIKSFLDSGREMRHEEPDGLLFRYRPAAALNEPNRLSVSRRGTTMPTNDEVERVVRAIKDQAETVNLKISSPELVEAGAIFQVVRITWYVSGMRRLI